MKFGLSRVSVDWGSAVDACPAGTWVCRSGELPPCDTAKPDGGADGLECDGTEVHFGSDALQGWVEDRYVSLTGLGGEVYSESGDANGSNTCSTLPVWCCWE